jgi:hypothetical protein
LRRFYGITSFSRYPLLEIIFNKNQNGICFLWDLGLWILTIQPSHSHTLAYCRPFHLISIEFLLTSIRVLTTIRATHQKNFSFLFNCHNLAIREVILTEILLQSISIVRYKILWLEVEKHHFIFIIGPHVNKYIFQAQYSLNRPWNFRD